MALIFLLNTGEFVTAKETLARMKYFVNIDEQIKHLLPLEDL